MKKGKTSAYLLYAFGEIILVVIGILIALQVNNWNIDRQNKDAEKQYLQRLLLDLDADLSEAKVMVNVNQYKEALGIYVLNRLGSDTENLKNNEIYRSIRSTFLDSVANSPWSFGERITRIRMYQMFNITDDTFKDLISSGKIDIIKSEKIKKEILNHYGILEDRMQLQYLKEVERNRFVDLLAKNGISTENRDDFDTIIHKIQDKEALIIQIENMISIHRSALMGTNLNENSIKVKTETLKKMIIEYLNSIN
jgi:hypothetical protein